MDEILRVSTLCSQLGYLVLNGNTEAVKLLYGYLWTEHPALVRTISQLQDCLTSVEVEQYADKIYCPEFLYYWGMICLGKQSPLIVRDLATAWTCFQKIEETVPAVKARLAYIDLLQSDHPAKSECNTTCIEALRKCGAYQRDMFSSIVLSKIAFYSFLEQQQENSVSSTDFVVSELPIRSMRLLERPCQQGHPVAIHFWNSMVDCLQCPLECLLLDLVKQLQWSIALINPKVNNSSQNNLHSLLICRYTIYKNGGVKQCWIWAKKYGGYAKAEIGHRRNLPDGQVSQNPLYQLMNWALERRPQMWSVRLQKYSAFRLIICWELLSGGQ